MIDEIGISGLCDRCQEAVSKLYELNGNGSYCWSCAFTIHETNKVRAAVRKFGDPFDYDDGDYDKPDDPCPGHKWIPTHEGSDHFECSWCGVMYNGQRS